MSGILEAMETLYANQGATIEHMRRCGIRKPEQKHTIEVERDHEAHMEHMNMEHENVAIVKFGIAERWQGIIHHVTKILLKRKKMMFWLSIVGQRAEGLSGNGKFGRELVRYRLQDLMHMRSVCMDLTHDTQ